MNKPKNKNSETEPFKVGEKYESSYESHSQQVSDKPHPSTSFGSV